jgi:hypothetical protein
VGRDGHGAVGLAVVLVDVDQVDVRRDIELAGAELAHAHDPEVDDLAGLVARQAVALVRLAAGGGQGALQRGLGQGGHGQGDVGQRRALLHVQHRQTLHHQLAGHPQRAGQGRPRAASSSISARMVARSGTPAGSSGRSSA